MFHFKLIKHHNIVMYSMKDGKNRSGGTSGMMVKKENKNSKNENCSMKGREHDEPNAPLFFCPD